jgi:hypothetical protein
LANGHISICQRDQELTQNGTHSDQASTALGSYRSMYDILCQRCDEILLRHLSLLFAADTYMANQDDENMTVEKFLEIQFQVILDVSSCF